jgi:hypothetical protein
MSETTTIQLTPRTLKVLATIAGGAGVGAVSRMATTLWFDVSLLLQFGSAELSMAISIGIRALFAVWFGWFLANRTLADWAAIGYFILTTYPFALILIQSVFADSAGDFISATGIEGAVWWPFLLNLFLPMFGFPIGAWLRLKRS